jgi:hypothetical protein
MNKLRSVAKFFSFGLKIILPAPVFNDPEEDAAGFSVTMVSICQVSWHHITNNNNVKIQTVYVQ